MSTKKSVPDLCMVSQELLQHVDSLVIDKHRTFTPYRPVSKSKVNFTDHYSLLLSFKNLPMASGSRYNKGVRKVIWNTNRAGGWDTFKQLTSDNKVLQEVADADNDSPEKMMKKLDKEVTRIKHEAFGKVKVRFKPVSEKELEALHQEKQSVWESSCTSPEKTA